jgi:hypothetical protein
MTGSDRTDEREAVAARLEELRAELRAERISYGELAELQGLAEHIEPGDVELLEAACTNGATATSTSRAASWTRPPSRS